MQDDGVIHVNGKKQERKMRVYSRGVEGHAFLASVVDDTKPDPFWWVPNGNDYFPRWGSEMLGEDF